MVVSSLGCRRHLWLSHSNTRRFKFGEIKAKLVFNASKSGCGESVSADVVGIGRRKVCDARLRCWFWARGFAVDRESQWLVGSRLIKMENYWTLSIWPTCLKEECLSNEFLVIYAALVIIYSYFESNTFTYLIKRNGLNFIYIYRSTEKRPEKIHSNITTLGSRNTDDFLFFLFSQYFYTKHKLIIENVHLSFILT